MSAASKEAYYLHKRLGLCVNECKREAAPGRVRCEAHLQAMRDHYKKPGPKLKNTRRCVRARRKKRSERRERGLCIECGKRAADRTQKCRPCWQKARGYKRPTKTGRRNRCGTCGEVGHNSVTCPAPREAAFYEAATGRVAWAA